MTRALAPALLAIALSAGCVTEVVRKSPNDSSTGLPSLQQPAKSSQGVNPTGLPNAPAKPSTPGPPAAAAPEPQTRTGRLLLSVRPVGFIDYDGLTLPLVSPDGSMIAVSSGQPPTWPTILAAPDGESPIATTILVYDIGQSPPRRIDWTPPMRGAVLGRSADTDGFLIEVPQAGGARWIGHVRWRTGEVRWLVKGPEVACHAILLRSGELVFSRRRTGERFCDLVLQAPSGAQRTLAEPGRSVLMPLAAPDQRVVAAFSVSPEQTDLVLIAPGSAGPLEGAGDGQSLRPVGRLPVAGFGSAVHAFQSAAGVQAAPNAVGASADPLTRHLASGILYINPRIGRICLYETALNTESVLPAAVAAAAVMVNPAGAGVLVTGEKTLELLEMAPGRLGGVEWGAAITGLSGPYVARGTASPDRFVLFGPAGPTEPTRLQVVGLQTLDKPPPGTDTILSDPQKAR